MYQKFLSARSPLRLLERGLHGGLGRGNVGLVLAGPGVGKTSFLVGVALDDLLRGDHVLHVALDQSVSHTRAYYDTVFHELAHSTHLEDEARIHADINRLRSIRSYAAPGFGPGKLREAVKFEEEAGIRPRLYGRAGAGDAGVDRGAGRRHQRGAGHGAGDGGRGVARAEGARQSGRRGAPSGARSQDPPAGPKLGPPRSPN